MFKNLLKTAFRNMLKHKTYSLINIVGLSIGLTSAILILLWVQDERSYDRFHERAKNIYRVAFADESYEKIRNYGVTPPAFAAALEKTFPEVLQATPFHSQGATLFSTGTQQFKETAGYVKASALDIFTLTFVQGNPETALENPNSVVITKSMANKLFSDGNPLLKTVSVENKLDLQVTGVFEDLPHNSSLNFSCLIPFENYHKLSGRGHITSWDNFGYNTYILLQQDVESSEFNHKIANFATQSHDYGNFKPRLFLQPLTSMHLRNLNGGGPITTIYLFSLIAGFILLIACVNFMNLATARSIIRSKEVGMRKVMGATKFKLIQQFYGESFLLSFIALLISIFLVELLLPYFNTLSGKLLSFGLIDILKLLYILIGVTVVTGLISGSYPALVLSSFDPVKVLNNVSKLSASVIRQTLVVFQFSLSIILIICTIVVSAQLNKMKNQYLGFDRDAVLYVRLNPELRDKSISIKNELFKNPNILNATATSSQIGIHPLHSVDVNRWQGNDGKKSLLLNIIYADVDFQNTFNVTMNEGRYFSPSFGTDTAGVILNEAAVREMNLKDAVGKSMWENTTILGVVKDFHIESLHSEIEPLAILMDSERYYHMAAKVRMENLPATIRYIEDVFKTFSPGFPPEYSFLDEAFDHLYRSEERLSDLFRIFSVLAILISCLGLFGLSAFITGRRAREIGIRKVLGSTTFEILKLLTLDFTKWVFLANVIAWPVAAMAMNRWLENYAYRTILEWWIFALAGGIALVIAWVTISFQAVKSATSNPVKALRYE